MAKKEAKTDNELDESTEERIKQAARVVFTKKGFAAARVRDIAEEADINLSLVNYYFRSKEKLFELVMEENLQKLALTITSILNEEETSITTKVEQLVNFYIDLLLENPDLPTFILKELTVDSGFLIKRLKGKTQFPKIYFFKQLAEELAKNGIQIHPLQVLINIIGMTAFPFIARAPLQKMMAVSDPDFRAMMEERRKMIPVWVNTMLKTKQV